MKKLLLFLTFISCSLFANSQDNARIQVLIGGHNSNDTIKIADFLKFTDVSLNNKDYSIVNFTLLFTDNGYDFLYVSNSDKITNEMKNALSKIKNKDSKIKYIVIKNITAQTSQNKKTKIEDAVFKLKLE
jgi:hypothetical protein